MPVTIYHNPRCSKSRATLKLLNDQGIEPRIVDYLNSPPSTTELNTILKLLKMEPRELLRVKEADFKKSGLANSTLSRGDILKAMVKYPKLIERPIVIAGKKAVLGRPPENVLKILKRS